MLSALGAVRGCISELPCNGGVAKTKGGRQNGGTRNILVTVILRFRCGKGQSDAAGIVCNLGGNRLNCVAVNYWHRLVLNLDDLSASHCIARIIGKLPCNRGIAKAKGRRQNGGTYNVLVTVVLRFWCGNGQCDAASVIGNFGSDWINCFAVNYWYRFV